MREMMNRIALPDSRQRYLAICDILEENNFEYFIQEEKSPWSGRSRLLGDAECYRNIIVPAKQNHNKLVLMAHYDVVPGSCGANDNASAICCIIEFLKRGGINLPYVEVVFTDSEEFGAFGCRQYIDKYKDSVEEVINIDTCGVGEKIVQWNVTGRTYTRVLFDKLPDYVIEVDHLPPCDASIILDNHVDVSCLCVLPKECTDITGENVKTRGGVNISGVFKYIHGGRYDDIKYIDYNALELMVGYLMLLL